MAGSMTILLKNSAEVLTCTGCLTQRWYWETIYRRSGENAREECRFQLSHSGIFLMASPKPSASWQEMRRLLASKSKIELLNLIRDLYLLTPRQQRLCPCPRADTEAK